NLPGSRGGVQDGLSVLAGVLDHAVDQLHGGDHAPATPSRAEVLRAGVADEPISADELAQLVAHRSAGAVVTFSGVVRDHDGGRAVSELEYVSHPSAPEVIDEVARDVAARFPGVRALAVEHRVGLLKIGDAALVCAVSADHRRSEEHTSELQSR